MTEPSKTFAELGVDPAICRSLETSGISTPFPIQELTLPLALSRADVIGQARTGTGKTLAFGIPLLQALDPARQTTQALVVVPTRELCLQVHDDLATVGRALGASTAALYGGKAIEAQSTALDAGAQVVVGTPGRLLDLRRRGVLDLTEVATLVLDEADEMLDMGFLPDVEQLIEACGARQQTLLFSATMPSEVVGLARRYMDKPTFMRADVEEPQIAPATQQVFLACHRLDKPAVLARILTTPNRGLCVVFTRTKRMADILVSELAERGVTASAIHSNLRQDSRERTMSRFRKGKVDVLCATEVAARGLDISHVTHVINYDCPDDEKMYLHRIGRTGRAGAAGMAVTLAVWNEQARLEMIKKALDIDAPTHEVFSTSPELDRLFDLPSTVGGTQQPEAPDTQTSGMETPSPAAPAGPADTRSAGGADRAVRRRVRRRAAPAAPAASGGPATAPARGGAAGTKAPPAPTREAAETALPSSPPPDAAPSDPAAAGDGARRSRSRKGRGSQRGRRGGRNDSPASARREPSPAEVEGPREAVAARGEGRPALTRPMTISHLP